jgi:putative FmdB family regulatory protein
MPIYEYQCMACHHALEALQKLNDPALTVCPACGAPQLQKKISAVGFRLSGSGWYETDFKKAGQKKNLAGDQGGASKSTDTASPAATASTTKSDSGSSTSTSTKAS